MITSPIWLPAALIGGALQAWRTAVQRRLGKALSVNATGLVRYLYGLPFAILLLLAYQFIVFPAALPPLPPSFFSYCAAAGLGQIVATNLLLMSFGERNFVVGTAYSKTEAVQSALLSVVLLHDRLGGMAWAGIGFGVIGVMVLSTGGKRMSVAHFVRALGQPAARYGIASGFLFALATIGIRAATMRVPGGDPIRGALFTLVTMVALQTLFQGGWVVLRERAQVRLVLRSWRVSCQVGMMSSIGSAFWFTGFATAPVALVRIVGQVEVAFTLAFAHFYLKERTSPSEIAGLILVALGVVLALAGSL